MLTVDERIIFPTLVIILSATLVADAQSPQLVDVGSHKLAIRCAGQGSPSVVIDVGIASQSADWTDLQNRLAETTHVCTYDRAGYGQSALGPFPPHAGQVVEELRTLLHVVFIRFHCSCFRPSSVISSNNGRL